MYRIQNLDETLATEHLRLDKSKDMIKEATDRNSTTSNRYIFNNKFIQ